MEEDLDIIELNINHAKESIEKMEALLRLTDNKDFIKVINEGYFEKEASRLVLMKAEPNMASAENQDMLDKAIISIGQLRQYFRTVIHMGKLSIKTLKEDQQTREEMLAEGV